MNGAGYPNGRNSQITSLLALGAVGSPGIKAGSYVGAKNDTKGSVDES